MDTLFLIQLMTSFIVGGSLIAFLSFWAERSSEKIAGIIISLPSTIAISFFFIGWTLSPEKVAEIAPMAPLLVGVVMMFTVAYLYLSKIRVKKSASIFLSLFGSLLLWFLLAVPLVIFEFNNLWLSLGGYTALTLIAYYFLTLRPKVRTDHLVVKYSAWQKFLRAVFAGFVISVAVFLSKVLGAFWGGLLAMFPAVFVSSLTILHYHYDSDFLFKVWNNAPIGTIIFTLYPIVAIYSFPAFGIWGGSFTAYAVALVAFLGLSKFLR